MEPNQVVDFESAESHFFFNPRLPAEETSILSKLALPELKAHIWLMSSGTTQAKEIKLIALSKSAFLIAAAAANRHLQVRPEDVWYKNLPDFHVGGLSIFARAHLSQSKVVDDYAAGAKWQASSFIRRLTEVNATLVSLVPTQVYDLVQENQNAPKSVRAVLVGGSQLHPELYVKARELGWPLLPTYGMTEVCSQIATASLESLKRNRFPEAIVLDHVDVRAAAENILEIKSNALFTSLGYASDSGLRIEDPKVGGWYRTSDKVDLDIACDKPRRQTLRFLGRQSDFAKVNGEMVSLPKLETRFAELSGQRDSLDFKIFTKDNERTGERICIASTSRDYLGFESHIAAFNASVAPYERIYSLYFIDELPRSALGKLKIGELKTLGS